MAQQTTAETPNQHLALQALLGDRGIRYEVGLARISEGAMPGLLLSQLVYWSRHTTDPEGWFWKTQKELEEETCITRYELETTRKQLIKKGFLEYKRAGQPAKSYYRLRWDNIGDALIAQSPPQSSLGETSKLLIRNSSITTNKNSRSLLPPQTEVNSAGGKDASGTNVPEASMPFFNTPGATGEPPDGPIDQVLQEIDQKRGYVVKATRAAEAKAIKMMLENYTTAQIVETWVGIKAEPYWEKKELSLMTVAKQIGAFLNPRPREKGQYVHNGKYYYEIDYPEL